MDSPWRRSLAVIALSSALGWTPNRQAGGSLPPNILVIVLDDVGTDKLAIYGETPWTYDACSGQPLSYPRTPNLDMLAQDQFPGVPGGGIRFTNFYANPVCNPTRACLLTGRYGFRTGLGVADDALDLRLELPNAEVLLPELLKNGFPAGPGQPNYECGAFGKWHLSAVNVCGSTDPADPLALVPDHYSHPIENGFDVFRGHMLNVGSPLTNPGDHYNWTRVNSTPGSTILARYSVCPDDDCSAGGCSPGCIPPAPYPPPPTCNAAISAGTQKQAGSRVEDDCTPPITTTYNTDTWSASVTSEDALTWINNQNGPFFAYVAFNAPHQPLQVPPFSLLSCDTIGELNAACLGPYRPGDEATEECDGEPGCLGYLGRLFYGAALEAVDTEIGNLISGIDSSKRVNTMIFVISDNGTPGGLMFPPHDLQHGKSTVYERGVRVPMIVTGPLVPDGTNVCDRFVHAVDLWRTVAQITGASETLASPLSPMDSIGFGSLLEDPDAAGTRDEIFCQGFFNRNETESDCVSQGGIYDCPNNEGPYVPTGQGPYEVGCAQTPPNEACEVRRFQGHGRSIRSMAVNNGRYKLIRKQVAPAEDGADVTAGNDDDPPVYVDEFYNLNADPEETNNLFTIPPPNNCMSPACVAYRTLRDRLVQLSGK